MSTRISGLLPAGIAQIGPNVWTKPFWDAAKAHRLVIPQDADDGHFFFPPAPFSGRPSQNIQLVESDGRATLYSFTIVRHAVVPELRGHVPYVIAIVDIVDAPGARLMTNIVECDLEELHVGMPLEVYWHDVSPEVTVPRFTPVS